MTLLCFASAKEVMLLSALVCLFVSRIAQKLLSHFSQNLMEMWHLTLEETIRFWCWSRSRYVRVRVGL